MSELYGFKKNLEKVQVRSKSESAAKSHLVPTLIDNTPLAAPATRYEYRTRTIAELANWNVVVLYCKCGNTQQNIICFRNAVTGNYLIDALTSTVTRGVYSVDWANNRILVRWVDGRADLAPSFVQILAVYGLVQNVDVVDPDSEDESGDEGEDIDITGLTEEVQGIRIGADGTIYETAGEAVREQYNKLAEMFDVLNVEDAVETIQNAVDTAIQQIETSGGLILDPTLTQSGQAADAKVVGDAISIIDNSLFTTIAKYEFTGSPTAYNARDKYIEYNFEKGKRYRVKLTFNAYVPAATSYKWRVELCDDTSGNNPVNEKHSTIAPEVGTSVEIDFIASATKPYMQIRVYTLAGNDFNVGIVADCYGIETTDIVNSNFTGEFSTGSAYEIGDFCTKEKILYRCLQAKSAGDPWVETNWEKQTFSENITRIDNELYREHKVVDVDWKFFSRWNYPTGWRQGYYDLVSGVYTDNGGYMCTAEYIDITGVDKIIAIPPAGYSVALTFFNPDGSVVSVGHSNTTSHPEFISFTHDVDTHDYVKCGITVGRFPNTTGQKGENYAANTEFINSIVMKFYVKTRNDIYSFYDDEMDQTINSVRNSLTEPALIFPLVTDIHFLSVDGGFNHCIENIREFCKRVKADFVLNLGDNTDGNINPEYTILRNMYMLDKFMEIDAPYYQAIGNHDVNGYKSTEKLTADQIYKSYLSNTRDVCFDLTAGERNYYKNFDELGIRLVVLDVDHNDGWKYSNNTATWLTSKALDTSNIVILAEHMSSISTQNWNAGNPVNSGDVTSAIQTFVNGGGTVIQLCGHSHADYHFTNPWLTIFTACQKFEKVDVTDPNYTDDIIGAVGDIVAPDRTQFTASQDCWTVFVIKPISRTINAIRFGAGNDMNYTF